jgi:acetyl-CoA synthetase
MHKSIIRKNLSDFKSIPNLPFQKLQASLFEEDINEIKSRYFSDGKMNAAYVIVGHHSLGEKKRKTALIYHSLNGERRKLSFYDLEQQSNKFANLLNKNNVKKGDRVFIYLPAIPERYIAFLGILKTGAIAGALFSAFQEIALQDRLADSSAKVLITNEELYKNIENIWKGLPYLEKVIIVSENKISENKKLIDYRKEMKSSSSIFDVVHMEEDEYAYMLYTSGTTGKPKGIVHSHSDIIQAMLTTKYILDVKDDDLYWCTADIGWVTGVVYGILGIWGLGGTSVIYNGRFSPENWYEVLQENNVSIWYTAPTAIRMLMGSVINMKDFDLSSLRHIVSVGEPLNPEALWWVYERTGLAPHDTWWQTELGSIAIANYPTLDIKPGSMGKPFPGIKAAVVDEIGEVVEDELEGDLALDPSTIPSFMKTIWGNEEKYKSYFSNGWYLTGDRAYRDSDGYFWFVGRFDDVINTSGERIGPFEVESSILEHPDVVEAGVIGKPDELRGEIIKAFVVLKKGIKPNEELKKDITQMVKKHFSAHAYPREIEFVENLPKTKSGKIVRRILKARELGLPEGDTSTLEEY